MGHQEVRTPPQNLDAEKSVLGAMLIEADAIGSALEVLDESWFYSEPHQIIYRTILDLYNNHKNADLITVSDKLRNENKLDLVGGITYLSELIDFVPSAANVEYYAQIVREKGVLRRLIKSATNIISECYDSSEEIEVLMDKAESEIFEVAELQQNQQSVHVRDIVRERIEAIDKLSQNKGAVTGVPTGFVDIDKMTSGLQPADLIIVAARPSMGKTAFAITIGERVAIEHNKPVAIFSLEMSKEQLVQRMLCSQARVDAQKVRTGFLAASDWPKLTKAAGVLSEAPIYIDDTPAISVLEMRSKARRMKANHDIQMIIIDYIQLMRGNGRPESRQQEISEISRGLKSLAREIGVPVIVLSQLSRAVEQRQDHRPMLSDLRESGAIEQDADVVMLMLREEYYNATPENENQAEVIIAKQRNGPVGNVKLYFQKQFVRFENLSKQAVVGE